MITRETPFPETLASCVVLDKIAGKSPAQPPISNRWCSEVVWDCVSGCLSASWNDRPDVDSMMSALNDAAGHAEVWCGKLNVANDQIERASFHASGTCPLNEDTPEREVGDAQTQEGSAFPPPPPEASTTLSLTTARTAQTEREGGWQDSGIGKDPACPRLGVFEVRPTEIIRSSSSGGTIPTTADSGTPEKRSSGLDANPKQSGIRWWSLKRLRSIWPLCGSTKPPSGGFH